MGDFIFMAQSTNDTPNDKESILDILSVMRVSRASTDLIRSLEMKGWWEADGALYEAFYHARGTEVLAGDLDSDGDVDAEDATLAGAMSAEAEASQAQHTADVDQGLVK